MGRLVRRFIQAYNLTVKNKIEVGTWASKITQHEAGQTMVAGVVNATALGGDVNGGYFGAVGSVSLTGNLYGVHSRVEVNDGKTLTGALAGLYIEASILGAGVVTTNFFGIYIEPYVEAGATLNTCFGICYAGSVGKDPTGEYSFMRFSENAASTVNNVLHIYKGASCTDIEYFLKLSGQGGYFSGTDTSHSAAHGWLKIRCLTEDRYIQLYT